jgi:hypothetical protein
MAAEPIPSSARLCLKDLAPHTLEVMRELESTTSEDIATLTIDKLLRSNPNLTSQDTIRRRIYDVINVLSAAGVIDKVGKQIIWHGGRRPVLHSAAPKAADESGIAVKEKALRDKVSLLTLYKALIKRNFSREPGPDALPLPVILIGIRDKTQATFTQALNRCDLEIRSHKDLIFMAPSDILRNIRIPPQSIRGILTLSPDFARYGTHLLDEKPEADQ